MLSSLRIESPQWKIFKVDAFLNYANVAIASWLEWKEYEVVRNGGKIWLIPHESEGTVERVVLLGLRNIDGVFRKRYENMNLRLEKSGFESWYWQMKWNKSEILSNPSGKKWLCRYSSFIFEKQLVNLNIPYVWSLSLKHIMTLHDAVFIEHSEIHNEYAIRGSGLEKWLPPLTSESSVMITLEDDAIFVPFFKEKLILTIHALPKDFPWIVWIGGCLNCHDDLPNNKTITIKSSYELNATGIEFLPFLELKPNWGARCTTGYAVNKMGARVLLEEFERIAKSNHYMPIDRHLDFVLKQISTKMMSFWSEPVLAYQSNKAVVVIDGDEDIDIH